MKKLYFLLFTFLIASVSFGQDLVITAVYDAPLTGGLPKGVELYVINDIADLSIYGIGSANNGGGSDGEEYTFPADAVTAGSYLYIASEILMFTSFFGFAPDYNAGSPMNINGDDAIELFMNGAVIDVFGDINVDGNGEPWEYLDGWAYRNDGTGPDGSTFVLSNWSFSGPNALDDETTNGTAALPIPIGTYSSTPPACTVVFTTESYTCGSNTLGDNNDGVTINIPYTNSDGGITSVTTTSGGVVGGNDPASFADGTITITGLMEGDAWDITINGGDCDGTTTSGTVPADQCDPLPSTCIDISNGANPFELVVVTANTDDDEWTNSSGTYTMNGFCGGGCEEQIETWLIFGPLDMTSVSDLDLAFDASESFGVTDLIVAYTESYSGTPSGSTWTTVGTITDSGAFDLDISAASGTGVYIGVQYIDDGVDGYSSWSLSNVVLNAFGSCPTLSSDKFVINNFKIHPNPTSLGYINIVSKNNEAFKVSVFDILGKQVINETISNNRLNVSSLNRGVYIMRISQDEAIITKKLIIN